MTPLATVVVLALGAWRIAVLVVHDGAMSPARRRVLARWPHTLKGPEHDVTIVPLEGGGWRAAAPHERRRIRPLGPGYLITCMWCVTVWAAAALTTAAAIVGSVPQPVLAGLAVAGGAALPELARR